MNKIGIIGGGFTGTMTAVQLVKKSTASLEIILINEKGTLNRGIAYHPYSDKHLLNVSAGKMSAFPNEPDHFLNWAIKQPDFTEKDKTLIANSFLPRKLYGDYLCEIWKEYQEIATQKNITLTVVEQLVSHLDVTKNNVGITLESGEKISVAECVIASGNHLPGNPTIKNIAFFKSPNYFQNPWKIDSVINIDSELPVLIIGNGLTMVDTVLGLMENGFKGEIYSISPNGFNILPHRHNGLKYTKLVEELNDDLSLLDLVKLVNKHIKTVRAYGVSAEPVIDSLRPYTQKIWQSLSLSERKLFMSRLRHLWGVARHRIPLHTHDAIQQLRIENKLHISSGKILDITESNPGISVTYFDKKEQVQKEILVSRVINCTGPLTNLSQLEKGFLKDCFEKGILTQDALKLGISTNTETFQVLSAKGIPHKNLYTIGSSLKGELWETTAVNELRVQAERLGEGLKLV
jgi:uncharacterized NAD(P)/FAD-binding protein YdhS